MICFHSGFLLRSYAKTTVACLVFVLLTLLSACLGLYLLPGVLGFVLAVLSLLAALGAAVLTCACVVVLVRHRRMALGERDLFLDLNLSREPDAIKAATPARTTRARRWLAQRLLGHDFLVGDLVEIKTWEEIRATLDESGCLEGLPFMPEMLAMCSQRAYVFRCVHRLFDYRKTRRMRHMHGCVSLVGLVCDGSDHGGCEAACHSIWKSAWLRRIERTDKRATAPVSSDCSISAKHTTILQFGSQEPRYVCQLTQLNAASQPLGEWSVINFLRPLIAGNVAPAAFAVGWLTHLFNELQHTHGGVGFPEFESATPDGGNYEETRLEVGDHVVVRSSAEIRATLDNRFIHRGMGFEQDMLKYCGHRYRVQAEVKRVIDIVTGETRTMKTPAYILQGIHFSGERQLFNAQYEPLFWRSAWLLRDKYETEVRPHDVPVERANTLPPGARNS
jgi:hypothetical protein